MNNNGKISQLETDKLSKFKTLHYFNSFGEINSLEDFYFYVNWAKENQKEIFILGNGSNTLFTRKKINSLVLKNNIKSEINCISEKENLYELSSTVMMHEVLNFCYKNSLDSFYYLSSVPATIGGALAMNAGGGRRFNKTIYDFVESITYIDEDNSVKKISPKDMDIEYRKTMFTGCHKKFIISAIFKFPTKEFGGLNPIKERIQWSKKNQDNTAPNCGSVYKTCNGRILRLLKGLKIGQAYYSSKTSNWINNRSKSSVPILFLIFFTKILHILFLRKCEVEIIRVK